MNHHNFRIFAPGIVELHKPCSTMMILIDNGHGSDTPGKRSPDGRFLEYKFNREIARRIVTDLQDRGMMPSSLFRKKQTSP